jgi:predicted site-specific integrase-resolvase
MSASSKFSFTISDLARFLGKSAVTLRGWERSGYISFPRNQRGDRHFTVQDLRKVAASDIVRERVVQDRLRLFEATITLLEIVEDEDRSPRSPRIG